jgi:Protein of unknown function (DUF2889)
MAVDVPAGIQPIGPAIPTPLRRLGSVRRTSTIDATWEGDARSTRMFLLGRCRDLLTPSDGGRPVVLGEDVMNAVALPDRTISEISAAPARNNLSELMHLKGGLRSKVIETFPEEVSQGTPLYLLLDDLSGATLVSGFAFTHWGDTKTLITLDELDPEVKARKLKMVNICAGFQEGASALGGDGPPALHAVQPVPNLPIDDDLLAWHELLEVEEVSARRSRRIDVWREGNEYVVDSFFQDSGTSPSGQRIAVHEYTIEARFDAGTGLVTQIQAVPQVLPFVECPMATLAVHRLIGQPIREFRSIVNELLPGVDGCTHMNDALRALAETPVLAAQLSEI